MSRAAIGAKVQYCGHDGYFFAEIFCIAGVNVVCARGPVSSRNLIRPMQQQSEPITHRIVDFPVVGFWRPDLGVFVVPEDQVTLIEREKPPSKPKCRLCGQEEGHRGECMISIDKLVPRGLEPGD